MRTTVDLPDDLFRQAKVRAALQGQSLKDLVADGLTLILKTPLHPDESDHRDSPSHKVAETEERAQPPKAPGSRRRGSAGEWARKFAGVATPAPGESIDDARMAHYRKKYDIQE